jgi:hypothetical protein
VQASAFRIHGIGSRWRNSWGYGTDEFKSLGLEIRSESLQEAHTAGRKSLTHGPDPCGGWAVEDAIVEARAGVKLAPEDMDNHVVLAEVLDQAQQPAKARLEYEEAIRLSEAQGPGYRWASIGAARGELAALNSSH